MKILLFLIFILFLSNPIWINDHRSLRRKLSISLSALVRSGLILIGALKRPTLDRAIVASVDLRNFISMGLGRGALSLYFPNRKQSLIELASIGRAALQKALVMFSKSRNWRSALDVLGRDSSMPYMTTLKSIPQSVKIALKRQ